MKQTSKFLNDHQDIYIKLQNNVKRKPYVRMIFKFIFFSFISHLQKQSQALSYKSSCAGKYEYFYNVGELLNISF